MARVVNKLTEAEIDLVRASSDLLGKTLAEVAKVIGPGVTTASLDTLAEEYIRDHGGIPGFKGLYGCPSTLLISVNDQVVHGLPGDRVLEEGDVASVDCGVLMNEFYGDSAYTFEIGEAEPAVKDLLRRTYESLYRGIEQAVAGNRVGDIGYAIQHYVEGFGYGVVRELVGHGLGRKLHEAPEVPNYGRRGHGARLNEGMVIAIEPMITLGGREVKQLDDGWTVATRDASPSAHYEHTVVVRKGQAEILTTFDYLEAELSKRGMAVVASTAE